MPASASLMRFSLFVVAAAIMSCLVGCATRQTTPPLPITITGKENVILAILPLGQQNPGVKEMLAERHRASWFPRVMYGKGEVSVLDDPYEEMALAMFNRFRGYNRFRRVVIVKDRAEADQIRATHMLVFHLNECYAVGRGANWNFVEWLTYEGFVDMDVMVYDLVANQRISHQRIRSNATSTSVWTSKEMRDYLRRQLLRGVTFNNAIAQIQF